MTAADDLPLKVEETSSADDGPPAEVEHCDPPLSPGAPGRLVICGSGTLPDGTPALDKGGNSA
jgi:hypothetical protein